MCHDGLTAQTVSAEGSLALSASSKGERMTPGLSESREESTPAFMAGGGQAGELMRATDWAATPVGDSAAWPASLKTAVGILLHSRHPMFLWWGPELIQFYNDAYLPSFGNGKHPAAMGQRGAECWQEIWPIIWPQIDDVMSRGHRQLERGPAGADLSQRPHRRGLLDLRLLAGVRRRRRHRRHAGRLHRDDQSRARIERRLRYAARARRGGGAGGGSAEMLSAAAGRRWLAPPGRAVRAALLRRSAMRARGLSAIERLASRTPDRRALDAAFGARLAQLASTGCAESGLPIIAVDRASRGRSRVDAGVRGADRDAVGGRQSAMSSSGSARGCRSTRPTASTCGSSATVGTGAARGSRRCASAPLVEERTQPAAEQAPVATALMTGPDHVFRLANPLYLRDCRADGASSARRTSRPFPSCGTRRCRAFSTASTGRASRS